MKSFRIILLSAIVAVAAACHSRSGGSGTKNGMVGERHGLAPTPKKTGTMSLASVADLTITGAQIPECESSRFISALFYTNIEAECIMTVTFADGATGSMPISISGNLYGLIEVAYKKISSGQYTVEMERAPTQFAVKDLFGEFGGFSSSAASGEISAEAQGSSTLAAKNKTNESVYLSLNLSGFGVGSGIIRLDSLTVEARTDQITMR